MRKFTTLSSKLICFERPENKAGTTDGGLKLEVYMTSAPIWLNPQNPAMGSFKAYAKANPHSLARRSTITINWKDRFCSKAPTFSYCNKIYY